jgi:hypothetical protein
MRAAGVPARVVTGYLGGEQNELSDYFIVRQSDAHAWAEVWLEEQGWVRVDPTAYVAPQRIEQGLFAAVEDTASLPLMARRDSPWLRELGLRWDAVNAAWNEWILAYGPERQREFLSGLGFGPIDWRQMTLAMVTALGLFVALATGLYLRKLRRHEDPVAAAYRKFCDKLARHKLGRRPHEAPLAYGERIAGSCPPSQASQARLITRLYTNLRFGNAASANQQQQLQRLVARFKL